MSPFLLIYLSPSLYRCRLSYSSCFSPPGSKQSVHVLSYTFHTGCQFSAIWPLPSWAIGVDQKDSNICHGKLCWASETFLGQDCVRLIAIHMHNVINFLMVNISNVQNFPSYDPDVFVRATWTVVIIFVCIIDMKTITDIIILKLQAMHVSMIPLIFFFVITVQLELSFLLLNLFSHAAVMSITVRIILFYLMWILFW